jgi:hypothetical protein
MSPRSKPTTSPAADCGDSSVDEKAVKVSVDADGVLVVGIRRPSATSGNQLWVRTTQYERGYLTANNRVCMTLPPDIGRPSIMKPMKRIR